ncbi:MAG: hypothetical protein JWN15_2174 [Firmicutes bacterium]|nr:hypothetical protein [Bacillota bacterium]
MSKVLGDIIDIDGRLREYDPGLSLAYDGDGRWTVHHVGRQGRPYPVLTIGQGTGNRWPKDDPTAPEVDRPDMRMLYLIRDADFAAKHGTVDQVVRDMELRELMAKEAQRAQRDSRVADVAREHFAFHQRDVDGAADYRINFPVAKAEGVA